MKFSIALTIILSAIFFVKAQPSIKYADRIRISEVYRIAELYGNKLWKDWDKAPFAILLIYDDNEFLITHPSPSDDFKMIAFDSLLNSYNYSRKRVFAANLLATFPAVNGLSTIVVGTPENTGKSSVGWIITILHEHFHQRQYSQPDYQSSVDVLDLKGGDETGMLMLNYPFPYEDERVNKQYKKLTDALLKVVIPFPTDNRLFNKDLNSYLEEREIFKKLLNEKDYKYFSFQLWQEGIARYTEYKIADMLSSYEPSEEFATLKDYRPFYKAASELRENIFNQLKEWELKDNKRLCFYSFGAAEGLLLDRVNINWKEKYFTEKFFIEGYYRD
jgi:hypothetical protein